MSAVATCKTIVELEKLLNGLDAVYPFTDKLCNTFRVEKVQDST